MFTKVYKPLWLATTIMIVGFKQFKNICFRTDNISTIDRYMYWMIYEGYIKVKKITSADKTLFFYQYITNREIHQTTPMMCQYIRQTLNVLL